MLLEEEDGSGGYRPVQRAPEHGVWGEVACLLSRKRDAIQPLHALGLLPGEVRTWCGWAGLGLGAVGIEWQPFLRHYRFCHLRSAPHQTGLPPNPPPPHPTPKHKQVPLSSALPFLEGALWGASERRRAASVARNLRRSEHVGLLGQLADERQRCARWMACWDGRCSRGAQGEWLLAG